MRLSTQSTCPVVTLALQYLQSTTTSTDEPRSMVLTASATFARAPDVRRAYPGSVMPFQGIGRRLRGMLFRLLLGGRLCC
jgi:hypothetical protein